MTEWTREREMQLRKLNACGMSMRQIAAELGVSRNAVIGKMSRMNLEAAPQKPGPQRVSIQKFTSRGPASMPPLPDGSNIPPEQRRTLLQLTNNVCKWPFGEPQTPSFFFCGAGVVWEGKPYCAVHSELAHRPK